MNLNWFNLLRYVEATALVMAIAILLARVLPVPDAKVRLQFLYLTLFACLAAPLCAIHHEQIAVMPLVIPMPSWQGATARIESITVSVRNPMGTLQEIILTGALLRLLWLCAGFVRLGIYRRRARLILPLPDHVRRQRFLRRVDAPIYLSKDVSGPVTFGWVDPAVLLPESFLELDAAQQSAIVCHELVHVQRDDALMVFGEELLRAVLWFHPCVWWLLERIQLCREQVVDAETIGHTNDRETYLETLIAFAERNVQPDLAPATAFFKRRHLLDRVKSIAHEVDVPARIRRLNTLAWYTLMPCTLALAVWMLPLQGQPQMATDSQGVTVSSPFELLHRSPVEVPAGTAAGEVVVGVTVGDSGEVTEARLISGGPELGASAIRSVRGWHFNPQFAPPRQFEVKVRYSPNAMLTVRSVDTTALPAGMRQDVLTQYPLTPGQSVSPQVRDRLVRAMVDRKDGLGVQASTTPDGSLDLRFFQGQDLKPPPSAPDLRQPVKVARVDAFGISEYLLNQFNIHPGDMISLAEANDRFQALRQLDPHVMISSSIDGDRMLSIRLSAARASTSPEESTRVTVKRIDASALPEPLRTEVLSRLGLHEGDSPSSGEINAQLAAACALDEHVDTTAFYLAGVSPQVEITFIYIPEGRRGQTLERWSQHPPAVIHMVPPVYPPLAMQARVQGAVRFLVTIQPDGSVSNIRLVAGHPLLVPAATEAMKQYRFEVKPSESKVTMDVNFVLPH